MILGTFDQTDLTDEQIDRLRHLGAAARGDVLRMTTLAASGHPGGSISSLDLELVLWSFGDFDPKDPFRPSRDRLVVSHGHTSPGAYAALAHLGYFDRSLPLLGFRRGGSPFEGHVERDVPGIEWATGNLGQGLSAACGFALAARLRGDQARVFCVLGDGEQQKGQLGEARRFAARFRLTNLVALLDWNRVQLSGPLDDIFPHDILADWRADGWNVLEVDGHDVRAIFAGVKAALSWGRPTLLACSTVMSKGIPFMEAEGCRWHGAALSAEKCREALAILGQEDDLDHWIAERKKPAPDWGALLPRRPDESVVLASAGKPRSYAAADRTDNRSAFGAALEDLGAGTSAAKAGGVPVAVLDCDLLKSTKADLFAAKYPKAFFQCGIAEQNAAVVNGALSLAGVLSVWSDFAMFGAAETYNAQRLNDINGANAKVFLTHAGVDVGEDGKTHHSLDYFGLFNSTAGWKVFTPADPNQTDRVVRWALTHRGNHAVVMGRSKIPVVLDPAGDPLFAGEYLFDPKKADHVRRGESLVLVAAGNMLPQALPAWELLRASGRTVDLYSVCAWSDLGEDSIVEMARHGRAVVVEDHNPRTGLGTWLQARFNDLGLACRVRKLGVSRYASSGPAKDLYRLLGLDAPAIARAVDEEIVRQSALGGRGWPPSIEVF